MTHGIATTRDPEGGYGEVNRGVADAVRGRHSGRSWRVGAQNCKSRVTRSNPLDTPLWPHCSGEHVAVARAATPGGSYGRWTVSRRALSGETARTVAWSFVKRRCFDDSRS